MLNLRNNKGFTLIELVITIAIISILAGLSIPVYLNFQTRNDLSISAHSLSHIYRRAQKMSQGVVGDETWGVDVASGQITLFKGISYVARDTGFDEPIVIPGNTVVTGLSEVVFDKLTGDPQQTGITTLTSVNGEVETVQINSKGMAEY